MNTYEQLDAWIDAHFDEQVRFLQELIRVPTDTPPGNNAPHADRAADLLRAMGLDVEKHPVPEAEVRAAGLESITNLVVRRTYGPGKSVLLNAHGDVVPPGEGWTHDPYGGEIADGKIYGRAAAVSKCDFSTYAFAVRALEAVVQPKAGTVELLFTYDEEFGGEVGPGWLLKKGLTKPDLMIAAGFSYQVVVAHNGCLQMEVTVHGEMSHAAIPDSGVDALQGATHILNALYAQNARGRSSAISHWTTRSRPTAESRCSEAVSRRTALSWSPMRASRSASVCSPRPRRATSTAAGTESSTSTSPTTAGPWSAAARRCSRSPTDSDKAGSGVPGPAGCPGRTGAAVARQERVCRGAAARQVVTI